LQVVHRETGDREGNAQAGRAGLFDIVGWVPVGRGFGGTFQHLFEMIEAKEQRGREDAGVHLDGGPSSGERSF
jgi:hypothetical protein